MATARKIKMRCDDGHEVLADIDIAGMPLAFSDMSSLTVNGIITHIRPCPTCGKTLSAPSGTYSPDQNGIMIHVDEVKKQ